MCDGAALEEARRERDVARAERGVIHHAFTALQDDGLRMEAERDRLRDAINGFFAGVTLSAQHSPIPRIGDPGYVQFSVTWRAYHDLAALSNPTVTTPIGKPASEGPPYNNQGIPM